MGLDLNALLSAAATIGAVSYKTRGHGKTSDKTRGLVLSETQHPRGFAGCSEGTRQTGQAFCTRGGTHMQMTWQTPRIPRAPFYGIKAPAPGKGRNPKSYLSCKEESEYPCGFAGDFGKTSPLVL